MDLDELARRHGFANAWDDRVIEGRDQLAALVNEVLEEAAKAVRRRAVYNAASVENREYNAGLYEAAYAILSLKLNYPLADKRK